MGIDHKEHTTDNVIEFRNENTQYFFRSSNGVILCVSVLSDKIIRFRYTPNKTFDRDFSYAIDEGFKGQLDELKFKEKNSHYRITTERLIVRIRKKDMRVRILDKSGTVLNQDEKGFHWHANEQHGGNIVKMSKHIQENEFFYGLGDKTTDLNLRSKKYQFWGTDTYGYGKGSDPLYKNIPFYTGIHHGIAYGLFFDNTFNSYFDFGKERGDVTSFWSQGGEMNYYFIYGPSLINVTESYTRLTGLPELPPLWALGYHQCKWSYYPESNVKEITQEFRKRKIPCDAIYLDIDYMDGFRCFTWNNELFPNPKKMISELRKDGFKTVVMIDPGIKIDDDYDVCKEGVDKDYFCHSSDGKLLEGHVWPGLCYFPDYTKPEVREWWADLYKDLIADTGVAGVWNDMNEPALFKEDNFTQTERTFPLDVRHDHDGDPCSHRKVHNVYGMQMARATYDGVKKWLKGKRPFVITRSCYAGTQRFSSAWTGDNIASWEHIWMANIQCQRLSVSGMSFVGSDIGGFVEKPDGELYVRWLQMGIFHPFCRTHSSGDHGDQEPWSFGDKYTEIAKKYIELRYQLLPYIYTTFWQYVQKGTPMLRPLAYIDQYDPETLHRMDEVALGDHILFCPVMKPGVNGRKLYLPKGEWYYYWNDKITSGGKELWADAPLDTMPIYVKAGAVLPINPVMQYVGEKVVDVLQLNVYYKKGKEDSLLYVDAGENYQYSTGDKTLRTFELTGKKNSISLKQNIAGDFKTEYKTYEVNFKGLPFTKILKITLDGKKIPNNTLPKIRISENFYTLTIEGK